MNPSKTEQATDYSSLPMWWQEGKDLGLCTHEDLFRYCELSLRELELSVRTERNKALAKRLPQTTAEAFYDLAEQILNK